MESREAPLAIDTLTPRFSWKMLDSDRGSSQSAYRILISTTLPNVVANVGDVWDSGKVLSTVSTNVDYAGPRLASDARYWWKVRLWDEGDSRGEWSEPQRFDIGLIGTTNVSDFIWSANSNANDFVYLRKTFTLPAPVIFGKVYVTAHDDYSLFVNGTHVGRGPAQNDPYDSAQLNAYDITSLLSAGDNVIAARAHFHGSNSGCGVLGEPAFFLQARVQLNGAPTQIISSDSTWRVLDATPYDELAPFRGPSFAFATSVEDYDARLEPVGWTATGFDDSSWALATTVTPAYQLENQAVPLQRTLAILNPSSVSEPEAGVFLVDFGENRSGWPILEVEGATAGDEVTIFYSEELSGGRIVRDRDRIDNYHDVYVARGDVSETWEPDVKYNGFRYLEVEGYPGTLQPSHIQFRVVGAGQTREDSFSSSNARYQAIYDISARTQENCFQGILTDSPQREQTQYAADAFLQSGNLLYNFDDTTQVVKMIQDFRDSDLGAGVLLARHPTAQTRIIPEWTLFWIQSLWIHHLHSDDLRLVQELYPLVQSVLASFDGFRSGVTNLLENVPGNSYEFGELDTSGTSLLPLNCLYFDALRKASDIAEFLGFPSDSTDYRNTADLVSVGIQLLFNGTDRYRDCTGSSQFSSFSSVLPLYFGITPAEFRDAVLAYVRSVGSPPDPVGAYYFYGLLIQEDQDRLLHRLLDQPDEQWGFMVASGSTTTWEAFVPDFSLSHGWGASPMQLFPSGVVGVKPTRPGFSTFEVRPHLGTLSVAEAVVPTPKGDIPVTWRRTPVELIGKLTVPANTTARIHIPAAGFLRRQIQESGQIVYENGAFIGGVPGIIFAGKGGGYVSFDLGSGDYSFRQSGLQGDVVQTPRGQRIRKP